jgi:hypothetical protein
VDAAQALYNATDTLDDPSQVWHAAAQLGIPVNELLEWAAQQVANLSVAPNTSD